MASSRYPLLIALLLLALIPSSAAAARSSPSFASDADIASLPDITQTGNWSGYMVTQGGYNEVAGSWDIPSITPPPSGSSFSHENNIAVEWIGVDGSYSGAPLLQVGTGQVWEPSGTVSHDVWWDILPAQNPDHKPIPHPVFRYDHMSAVLKRAGSGTWTIAIRDATQNWTYVIQEPYTGPGATAEWVTEAPAKVAGGMYPLANYGATLFDGALANQANPHLILRNALYFHDGEAGQNAYSTPSIPNHSGDGFGIAYNDGSAVAPEVPSSCPSPVQTGDLNGDGMVDLTDLSIFAGDWGRGPRNGNLLHSAYSDINCDGVVDLIDFSIFAANWRKQWSAQPASSEVMGAAPSPGVTGSNSTMQAVPSAAMAISPSTGTFNVGDSVTASLMIDGGGQAFNAAQATVNLTGPATVQSLTPGDCGFSFAQAPTTSDPSFPGAILGASSTKCTVYTVTLRVTGSSPVGITLSDAAVLDAASSSDILSSVTSATYNASAPTDTPQPSATDAIIPTVTPANTATPTGTSIAPTATDIPPTNTPHPTDTPTSTNTPTATAPPTSTNTPVPSTSSPTTAPTSTATDTPIATAPPTSAPPNTPPAMASPTTPPTAAVKESSASSQNAPATTPTTAAKPRTNTGAPQYGQERPVTHRPYTSPVALTLKVTPRVVASGRWLTVSIRTAPRARVTLLLQLPVRRTVSVKKGKSRLRVTRTVILRLATAQGFADTRGQFTRGLHVVYKVSHPVRASLTVTISTAHGRIIRQAPVTIQPPSHHLTVRVTPHVLMLGRPLVVAAHTLPHVAVVVDLHIMERRMVTVAKGRTHVRVARTAQVYGVSWHGRTGPKGWASPTFRVPSRSGQSLTATLTVTAALPHGLDVHTISVPMR